MLKSSEFLNKMALELAERIKQHEKEFNEEIDKIKDPKQKAIIIEAMRKAQKGDKIPTFKDLWDKINTK